MSAPEDPWTVLPSGDAETDRRMAIERGLRAHGYDVEFGRRTSYPWPGWATLVYFATDPDDEVDAVRAVAEGGQGIQDAVVAAYRLGDQEAVRGLVASMLAERRAQG